MILVDVENARTAPVHEPHFTLALTSRGDDVTTTIVDGQVLMEDGEFLTLDADEILAQSRERAERIFGVPSPVD
jgi:cytosine/adenosine deaminase-related metal-dependent hydrolase